MTPTHGPASTVDHDLVVDAIDRETQALLDSVLGGFLDMDLQFDLILEDFTGGQVLTHLSRQADRMADQVLEATGRPVPPIDVQRQWDVDLGGLRPGAVLIEDFVDSSTRLQAAMADVQDWSSLSGDTLGIPARRLVQLVVHHADLTRSWDAVPGDVAAHARAQLAWATGRVVGVDSGPVLPAPARRTWF